MSSAEVRERERERERERGGGGLQKIDRQAKSHGDKEREKQI